MEVSEEPTASFFGINFATLHGFASHQTVVFTCYFCLIKTNKMHFSFLIYFNNHPLHVSNGLTIYQQQVLYCIYCIWYLSCVYVD
jgi:hypothetical protein